MDSAGWVFIALAIIAVIGIAVVASALVIHNYRIERWAANERSRPKQEAALANRTRPRDSGYRRPSGSQPRANIGAGRETPIEIRNNIRSTPLPTATPRAKFGRARTSTNSSISGSKVSNPVTERRTCPVCNEIISQRDYREGRVMICKCDTHYHLSSCYQNKLGSVCPICSQKGN